MNRRQIVELIDKFLSGNSTPEEKEILSKFIDSEDNFSNPSDIIDEEEKQKVKQQILRGIDERISSRKRSQKNKGLFTLTNFYKAAAVVIPLSMLLLFWTLSYDSSQADQSQDYSMIEQENPYSSYSDFGEDIIMKQSDGSTVAIELTPDTYIVDPLYGRVAQINKEGELVYVNILKEDPSTVFQHLILVPFGKNLKIRLSDGSFVHMNSGSSLTVPLSFYEDRSRDIVFSGEAFFDVTTNKTSPFICQTSDIQVQVYGTEFVISAYPDSKDQKVFLQEGSLGVKSNNSDYDETILRPNTVATLDTTSTILVTSEAEPSEFTSWREGVLTFTDESMNTIITKLEKKYAYSINRNADINYNHRFTGRFTSESLEDILGIISRYVDFSYSIDPETKTVLLN